MKKTRASYTDTFKLIQILNDLEYEDLLVKVERVGDKKIFTLKLSDLEAENSDVNKAILHAFSVWLVNY